ncbi:unnamed protein product, partial [Vitis vinifera]
MKMQVQDNPSGDFPNMFCHISKGSWTLSHQDHGWQVSDCTAEGLKCCLLLPLLPPEIVGQQLQPQRLYDAVNILLSFQVRIIVFSSLGASKSIKMVGAS